MFQFSWVGVPLAIVCILVITWSSRLLPAHEAENGESMQAYFLEAHVAQGSALAGHTVEDNGLRNLDGLYLVEILRSGHLISPVTPDMMIEAGDLLIFSGEVENLQVIQPFRSEERRVWKVGVSTCRSRWSPLPS